MTAERAAELIFGSATNTRKRIYPEESTEFGMWLREQPELDSKNEHLVCTAGFFVWKNYESGKWMLIQTKRYNMPITRQQRELFETLEKAIKDINFYGFHVLEFEKTCPNDGMVTLNDKYLTNENLLRFLRFELPIAVYYKTWR